MYNCNFFIKARKKLRSIETTVMILMCVFD